MVLTAPKGASAPYHESSEHHGGASISARWTGRLASARALHASIELGLTHLSARIPDGSWPRKYPHKYEDCKTPIAPWLKANS